MNSGSSASSRMSLIRLCTTGGKKFPFRALSFPSAYTVGDAENDSHGAGLFKALVQKMEKV